MTGEPGLVLEDSNKVWKKSPLYLINLFGHLSTWLLAFRDSMRGLSSTCVDGASNTCVEVYIPCMGPSGRGWLIIISPDPGGGVRFRATSSEPGDRSTLGSAMQLEQCWIGVWCWLLCTPANTVTGISWKPDAYGRLIKPENLVFTFQGLCTWGLSTSLP